MQRVWSPYGVKASWQDMFSQEKTRGYRHHPQLERFRTQEEPVATLDAYLDEVVKEATRRDYNFNRSKLGVPVNVRIALRSWTVRIRKFSHLLTKLQKA